MCTQRPIAALCVVAMLATVPAYAQEGAEMPGMPQPTDVPRRPSAEFYSTGPTARFQMPVNIWGEVHQPGIHFVPVGASLVATLSAAGGPLADAAQDSIRIRRGDQLYRADLFEEGERFHMQSGDVVFVERSIKRDLPLIFSAVTTVVSVVTLYFVTRRK